ncbi:TRAP transporter small permease subunit [Octadecabacter sp. CECT 8868]|uniref:TRAP transporter small permease subunit n=1 Tax=Octadecabacter algicola TaxID=2909342 RepID=UPI001F199833|nr:TRAP transporter small permease subunit [Octadecabacter algicola]MCF2903579.1 TRAP transporter small permease subunit [Octadecabacter algicola]
MEEDAAQEGFWASYENGFTVWVERLQGNVPEGADPIEPAATVLGAIWNSLVWFFANILEAFYNIAYAVTHPAEWLAWLPYVNGNMPDAAVKESLMRFIYFGGSVELFFAVFSIFLLVTIAAFSYRPFMWGCVRALEGFANTVGRFFAWSGLLMVLIQVVIIFMQRVFAVSEISIGFGMAITHDVSWWAESLKLYNAMIVCLCVTYTFVQGSHVRVDLVYSAVSHRTKRVIDMIGSIIFMVPAAVLTWMYGWYFLWRHMVVPNPSASDSLDRLITKARALRWNIETIGFSPNGFNAYFLFKILLVTFTALVLLQAVAFFYRSYLELVEGEGSVGKHLDRDSLGEGQEAFEGTH